MLNIEDKLKKIIKFEIIDNLYKQIIPGIVCHLIAATLLVNALYKEVAWNILILWYLTLAIMDVIWMWMAKKYFQKSPGFNEIDIWEKVFLAMLIIVSSIFGSAGILLMPANSSQHQFYIMFFLIALSATLAYCNDFQMCKLALCALLLPLFAWCIYQKSYLYINIAILISLYFIFLFSVAKKNCKVFEESLELRFKNIHLNKVLNEYTKTLECKVKERTLELSQAKAEADLANKAKTEFLGIVSHELRTPLRTIDSGVKGLKKYYPPLVEAYEIAKAAQLTIPYIVPRQYDLLPSIIRGIEQETNSAFNFINMLLTNLGEIGASVEQAESSCSIARCIQIALERYPFAEGERELIDWSPGQDFLFKGNEVLMVHVIFNLLKNALHYIHEEGKGRISIWLELGDTHNTLHFKDTAKGIAEGDLSHVFDKYFSKSKGGTGLGLAFCKMIMASFGGSISCESRVEKYTDFALAFANLKLNIN